MPVRNPQYTDVVLFAWYKISTAGRRGVSDEQLAEIYEDFCGKIPSSRTMERLVSKINMVLSPDAYDGTKIETKQYLMVRTEKRNGRRYYVCNLPPGKQATADFESAVVGFYMTAWFRGNAMYNAGVRCIGNWLAA